MRNLLTVLGLPLGVALLFACSSSAPPPAEDAKEDPAPKAAPATSENDLSTGFDTDAGTGDAGIVMVDTGDAGSLCEATSVRESEPNDDTANADAIEWKTTSFCGRVSGTEADWLTFTIPTRGGFDFTFGMFAQTVNGRVAAQVDCQVDGQAFSFNGVYPFVPGKPYSCKISSRTGDAVDYRFHLNVTTR
jgi:hypothetical protein